MSFLLYYPNEAQINGEGQQNPFSATDISPHTIREIHTAIQKSLANLV